MRAQAISERRSTQRTRLQPVRTLWVLLVGSPSAALERRMQVLQTAGFSVTHAESVCHAEMYSEAQYFDAAIYDPSLSEVEQVSLARIMRVRWPWMRLVRCSHAPIHITRDALFDASEASESHLAESLRAMLS